MRSLFRFTLALAPAILAAGCALSSPDAHVQVGLGCVRSERPAGQEGARPLERLLPHPQK